MLLASAAKGIVRRRQPRGEEVEPALDPVGG